ncbi:hypothetical protein DSECCO2_528470 [anaerobic digester metagenome]
MVGLNPLVNHRDDHFRVSFGNLPCLRQIDIGIGGTVLLTGIVIMPLFIVTGVIRRPGGAPQRFPYCLSIRQLINNQLFNILGFSNHHFSQCGISLNQLFHIQSLIKIEGVPEMKAPRAVAIAEAG